MHKNCDGTGLTIVHCYFKNGTILWKLYLVLFLFSWEIQVEQIDDYFSCVHPHPFIIKTGGDESLTFKSCDPNMSKSFSELLRNANASHAQKQKEMSEAESSSKDGQAAGSSKDDSVTKERDDIHFDPIVQLPEQVSNEMWLL